MREMLFVTATALALTFGVGVAESAATTLSPGAASLTEGIGDHLIQIKNNRSGHSGNVGARGGGNFRSSGNVHSGSFVRSDSGGVRGSARVYQHGNSGSNKNFRSGNHQRWAGGDWKKHHKRRPHRTDLPVFGYADPWWESYPYDYDYAENYDEDCFRLLRRWIDGRRVLVRVNVCI